MNIIDLQNITVFQGRNKVLDDFSLTIDESQSTVILGPNGSGKTTLLKLLNRELYIVEDPKSSLKIFEKDKWNVDELRSNILGLEGAFAVLGGWLILDENLSTRGLIGCGLMLSGMFLSQLLPRLSLKKS